MKPQKQKGMALITIFLIIMLIFILSFSLSIVLDKNLKFFRFQANKELTHNLAKSALEYLAAKGSASALTWNKVTTYIYSTDQMRLDPSNQYYFQIQDTNYPNSSLGQYQFIGILKDIGGVNEAARTVLTVTKPIPVDISQIKTLWRAQ